MKKGLVEVYCGPGKGKSTLAIGRSIRACAQGKSVIVIQFLKGRESGELEFLEKLDQLDLKIFRFEKSNTRYEDLSDQEKQEEEKNILNGMNFAKKVIATEECDLLILDEIFGVVDYGIISTDDLIHMIGLLDEMHLILTGDCIPQELRSAVDYVTVLKTKSVAELAGECCEGKSACTDF